MIVALIRLRSLCRLLHLLETWEHSRHSWHTLHWHLWHLWHLRCTLSCCLTTSGHLTSHLLLQQSCILHLLMIHVNVLLLHVDNLLLVKLLLLCSHVWVWLHWWWHHHVRILSIRELHTTHHLSHIWHLRLCSIWFSILLCFSSLLLLFFLFFRFLFFL